MLALLFGALSHDGETDRPIPLWGAVTIRGCSRFRVRATGVGGGAFLAPILIALHSVSETNSSPAPFILYWQNIILPNSIVGLAGALYVGQSPTAQTWQYALAALAG